MRVRVFLERFEDAVGYDVKILSQNAVVQDYIDALNKFQDDYVAPCKGCDNCCWERIPLTSADVVTYLENQEIIKALPEDISPLTAFIHKFCYVFGDGPVVDISLKQRSNASCIFLNTDEKICSLHPSRSLVCQTFICLPHSERAGKLRDTLLNTGEDELTRQYLLEANELGKPPEFHENRNASPQIEDYPLTAFAGKGGYNEVRIKDVIPAELWDELFDQNSTAK